MIEVENLSKQFGSIRAVDNLSFRVEKGEILGFLGPNGAGKSTTMKMITCFLAPSEGVVKVGGYSTEESPEEVKKLIGYLPETSASYADMNVTEFLEFIAEVRGYRGDEITARVENVIKKCFLDSVRYQTIDTLSKGYRQRVGFAQAILHDPPVLILDEPTDGLDPNQKHEVRNLIKEMGKDKCIILSTHILEEVDAVCSRAIIISNGSLVADDTPENIRSRSGSRNVVDLSIHKVQAVEVTEKLKSIASVDVVEVLGEEKADPVHVRVTPREKVNILPNISELVKKENWTLDALHQERGRLDEVFRDLTEGDV